MLEIVNADPACDDARPLLVALFAYHGERTPPDGQSCGWGIEALNADGVTFFLAYQDGIAVGMAAYAAGYSELKSMFVADAARGTGVADALVQRVEQAAQNAGILRLETGPKHFAALKFYEKAGFTKCERFGSYIGSDYSVCMSKLLTHTG